MARTYKSCRPDDRGNRVEKELKAPGQGLDRTGGLTEKDRELYERIPPKIAHVPHSSFASKDMAEQLFGAGSHVEVPQWTQFAEVPEEIPSLAGRKAVLKPEEEHRLFLRYNYARYRLGRLVASQRKRRTAARARQMVRWFRRVLKTRADLARANMALVLAMAKRMPNTNVEFGELVSEGNLAMLRSIDKFDVSRGYKFSTYACRAILKSFARLAIKTRRYRQHFPVEFDPKLERSDYELRRHEMQRNDTVEALRGVLAENHAKLTDVEREVLMKRFAIGSGEKAQTLATVGKMVGLTNERVRQIQNKALGKLRFVLNEHPLVP